MATSKKIRFDIFKRDDFKCQYCGRTPPSVTLEIDHINPRSKGGKDDTNNYITACFDCNRGKGKNALDTIPEGIQENLKKLKERQGQLKAYNNYLLSLETNRELSYSLINAVFNSHFDDHTLNHEFLISSVRTFLIQLPESKVIEAMKMACSKINEPQRAIKYFCGICWKWIKNPELRDW